jgi:hypothetical protein
MMMMMMMMRRFSRQLVARHAVLFDDGVWRHYPDLVHTSVVWIALGCRPEVQGVTV